MRDEELTELTELTRLRRRFEDEFYVKRSNRTMRDELTRPCRHFQDEFYSKRSNDTMRTRLCHHFQAIANLPPNVYMDDDPNILTLNPNLKHPDNLQLMREVVVDVLTKHARVRSKGQYLKILCDFHFWCREQQGLYSITDIGIKVWLSPVVKRWRLVREAAALCTEAVRRERWWLAFAESAFHPGAAAVDAAAAEFAALAAN